MQDIKNTANFLDGSFWIGNRDDTVYGIFQPDKSLYVNTHMAYRLVFRSYNSGYFVNADSFSHLGGINLDGTIEILDDTKGTMTDINTIVWNNGDVWRRVSNVPINTLDTTDIRNNIDERESSWLNGIINKVYKTTWSLYPGEDL